MTQTRRHAGQCVRAGPQSEHACAQHFGDCLCCGIYVRLVVAWHPLRLASAQACQQLVRACCIAAHTPLIRSVARLAVSLVHICETLRVHKGWGATAATPARFQQQLEKDIERLRRQLRRDGTPFAFLNVKECGLRPLDVQCASIRHVQWNKEFLCVHTRTLSTPT